MKTRGRKNWNNLEINKRLCKQLILHRVWNNLSQSDLAMDIGTTYQQYSKVEKCDNRLFAEQLVSICNNRGWQPEIIMKADPEETLKEWMKRDYPNNIKTVVPDKYNKVIRFWNILNQTAAKNYYGEDPMPFVVDKIEKGN